MLAIYRARAYNQTAEKRVLLELGFVLADIINNLKRVRPLFQYKHTPHSWLSHDSMDMHDI